MEDSIQSIYVYGTLRMGRGNWTRYLAREPKWTGRIRGLAMGTSGFLPMCWPQESSSILVEQYEVTPSELASIDQLEGHPNFYRRVPVSRVIDKVPADGWIYIIHSDRYGDLTPVPSGDYDDVDIPRQ